MPSYFSTWGPLSGPIRSAEVPPAVGVVLDPSTPPMPDGIAYPAGYVEAEGGAVVTWRLVVAKVRVAGCGCASGGGSSRAEEWGRTRSEDDPGGRAGDRRGVRPGPPRHVERREARREKRMGAADAPFIERRVPSVESDDVCAQGADAQQGERCRLGHRSDVERQGAPVGQGGVVEAGIVRGVLVSSESRVEEDHTAPHGFGREEERIIEAIQADRPGVGIGGLRGVPVADPADKPPFAADWKSKLATCKGPCTGLANTDPGSVVAVSPDRVLGSGTVAKREEENSTLVFRLKMKSVVLGSGNPERVTSISNVCPTVSVVRSAGDDRSIITSALATEDADASHRTRCRRRSDEHHPLHNPLHRLGHPAAGDRRHACERCPGRTNLAGRPGRNQEGQRGICESPIGRPEIRSAGLAYVSVLMIVGAPWMLRRRASTRSHASR